MSEHLEALERLSELKNRGVLTNEEFEEGKAKLLKKRASAGRPPSSLKQYLALSALGIGSVGAFFFAQAALVEPGKAGVQDEASTLVQPNPGGLFAPASMWNVSTARDPISDMTVQTAVAVVEGKQFDIEVSISCTDGGEMRYGFRSFDKAGEPAPMRSEFYAGYSGAGYGIPFQLRAADAPAFTLSELNPEYNNQVEFRSTSPMPGQDINYEGLHKLATSDHLVGRFFMLTGEETVELSQSDAAVRDVLNACVAQREAKRSQHELEVENRRQQEMAKQQGEPHMTSGM